MKVLVSACLLGKNCKYNGGNNFNPKVVEFLADKEIIPVCPELLAGLGTPRNSAEIVNGTVLDIDGKNIDREFRKGVQLALEKISGEEIAFAVLQPRSPTCGVNQIYDGSFSGKLISGQGLLARELIARGYNVIDASDLQ